MSYYQLPATEKDRLGRGAGVPWELSKRLDSFNDFIGLCPNSAQLFELEGGLSVLMYESKFDVDGDGSGGNEEKDGCFQNNTSLHDRDNKPLNARKVPFAVIPLPIVARVENWADYLALADVGLAFHQGKMAAYTYGDFGPNRKHGEVYRIVGEGSILLATQLGINPDPNHGGIQPNWAKGGRGVVHCAFINSSDRPAKAGKLINKTMRSVADITAEALQLWNRFTDTRNHIPKAATGKGPQ